jgi:hypothetical protein
MNNLIKSAQMESVNQIWVQICIFRVYSINDSIFLTMIILFTFYRFLGLRWATPLITGVPNFKSWFWWTHNCSGWYKRILVSIEKYEDFYNLPRQNLLLQVQKKIMVNRGMLAVALEYEYNLLQIYSIHYTQCELLYKCNRWCFDSSSGPIRDYRIIYVMM